MKISANCNNISSNISKSKKGVITGIYRLISIMLKVDHKNKNYYKICMSNTQSEITAYYFDLKITPLMFISGKLVHIEAIEKFCDGRSYFHVNYLTFVEIDSVLNSSCINYIPSYFSPKPTKLLELKNIYFSITCPYLREFVLGVIIPLDICIPFIQVPASLHHHHNYVGGLLDHSIEVTHIILCLEFKSEKEKNIAIVCALLHDIAKVKTLNVNLQRTHIGKFVDHDELTLEVCAQALELLDEKDSFSATLIRNIWTCRSPKARYGYLPASRIAYALQNADKLSASFGGLH